MRRFVCLVRPVESALRSICKVPGTAIIVESPSHMVPTKGLPLLLHPKNAAIRKSETLSGSRRAAVLVDDILPEVQT